MIDYILLKYLHFSGIFGVVGTLIAELIMIKASMTRTEIAKLSRIDGLYGLSAIIVVLAGLIMWFWVGKPAEFYTKNWIFHTKVTLFVVIGLLSIFPTIFFIKQRKGDPSEQVVIPGKIINIVRIEVFLLFVIPILAILMALGIGSF